MKKLMFLAWGLWLLTELALAVEPHPFKEGLWSVRTQTAYNPGSEKTEGTYKLCRSHAYDEHAHELMVKTMKGCKTWNESWSGGKYSAESECNVAGTVSKSKTTATYESDTSYHSETRGTYTPALGGISEVIIIMDQKYLGACPAGVQPGDRIAADGTVMHTWRH